VIRKTDNENAAFSPPYKNLIVWQVADELARLTYGATKSFPRHEVYGLTSQLRRAALSIVLNIIEGSARSSKNEFRQFLRISLGSLAETTYLLEFALEQGYLNRNDFQQIMGLRERCGKLLWKLFKSQT